MHDFHPWGRERGRAVSFSKVSHENMEVRVAFLIAEIGLFPKMKHLWR